MDQGSDFAMGLRKSWEVVGLTSPGDGARPLSALARHGITVRRGTVTRLDAVDRRATIDGEEIRADALVVALGARHDAGRVPGLAEHAIDAWDRRGALAGREALGRFEGGRLAIGIFGTPYSCPPGPFELALLAAESLARRGVAAEVEVFGPMPIALPVAGAAESARLEDILADRGIAFLRQHQAVEVTATTVRFADGEERPFELLLAVPPHGCPELLVEAGLADAGGWVRVEPRTLETGHDGVYAIGDCTVIPLAGGLALPKAGVFAEAEGEVVAGRIADAFAGREPRDRFAGDGLCYAEVGGGRAAAVRGSFLADPPAIAFLPPTPERMDEKRAFERERLDRWFGG